MAPAQVGSHACRCELTHHTTKLVVLTGGPCAGKTAALEMARRSFCEHVAVLPEAASIVFGGGFPRHETLPGRRAAQRAIFHMQRQLETLTTEEGAVAVALCDRGTVDGLAYWPGDPEQYWLEVNATLEQEFGRYAAVIHLETPEPERGYNRDNALRIETAEEAKRLDRLISKAWEGHPRRTLISSAENFVDKALRALELVRNELPPCCQSHPLVTGSL